MWAKTADIQESVEGGAVDVETPENDAMPLKRTLMIGRHTLHLLPAEAEEFYRRLRALIREYVSEDEKLSGSPDEQSYGLLMMLYPSTRLSRHGKDEKIVNQE
ncbi:MAG TPA: hypothetical protein VHO69_09305 [Phototrophicaceae bacterium]|nr:hypothetical protein [Phototrophicaceae bacterium]